MARKEPRDRHFLEIVWSRNNRQMRRRMLPISMNSFSFNRGGMGRNGPEWGGMGRNGAE